MLSEMSLAKQSKNTETFGAKQNTCNLHLSFCWLKPTFMIKAYHVQLFDFFLLSALIMETSIVYMPTIFTRYMSYHYFKYFPKCSGKVSFPNSEIKSLVLKISCFDKYAA